MVRPRGMISKRGGSVRPCYTDANIVKHRPHLKEGIRRRGKNNNNSVGGHWTRCLHRVDQNNGCNAYTVLIRTMDAMPTPCWSEQWTRCLHRDDQNNGRDAYTVLIRTMDAMPTPCWSEQWMQCLQPRVQGPGCIHHGYNQLGCQSIAGDKIPFYMIFFRLGPSLQHNPGYQLRHSNKYPLPLVKTNRFKFFFISWCLCQ